MRKLRRKKVTITPELVELFRAGLPAQEALLEDAGRLRRKLTDEQHEAARAAVDAFYWATGCQPHQRSALHENTDFPSLRAELLARLKLTRRATA